jgi:hypothetical protein
MVLMITKNKIKKIEGVNKQNIYPVVFFEFVN